MGRVEEKMGRQGRKWDALPLGEDPPISPESPLTLTFSLVGKIAET